jgi:mycothiol synthase
MNVAGTIRDATEDDAEAILDLSLLSDIADIGEPDTTIELIRADLVGDMAGAVIEDVDGSLLGYAWVDYEAGHAKTWGDITLRPGVGAAVAPVLLDWLRAKAQELGPGLPTHTFAGSTNLVKQRLYDEAGGKVIRRFFRMGVELDDAPPPAVPPMADGVEIRGVTTDADLHTMYEIVDVAFLDHFAHESGTYEKWAQHSFEGVAGDLSLWWLATVDGVPASGIYGSLLPAAAYVDTLGTLSAYRGKGLGRALLLTAFAEFHRRGFRKVVLGVDATNPTGALGLYESVGMKAEHRGLRYELPA